MIERRGLFFWFAVLVVAGCTGNQPPPAAAANPPVDRSATVQSEIGTIEGPAAETNAEAAPTREPQTATEPLTRGEGSSLGDDFANGVHALADPTNGDPCADVADDMAAYDHCRYEHDVNPCREDYMGGRDPCFDMTGDEQQTCIQEAKQQFCDCLRDHGHPGGGC